MKKNRFITLLIVVIVCLVVGSCDMMSMDDIETIISDVILESNQNIKPKSDYPYTEYWEYSENTIKSGYGDCEDYVIVAVDAVYKELGIKTNIAISIKGHALLEYMGKLYECTDYYSTKPQVKHTQSSYALVFFDFIDSEIKLRRF